MTQARAGQRSQSMVEFALVAPLLLLTIFAVVDLGRGIYAYVAIKQAANEAARAAIQGRAPLFQEPTNADIAAAAAQVMGGISLAPSCPNGPIAAGAGNPPPANAGYLYITQPDVSQPSGPQNPNTPGGELGQPAAGCWNYYPAAGHDPLRITIVYNFVPATPIFQQLLSGQLVLNTYAIYRTEY